MRKMLLLAVLALGCVKQQHTPVADIAKLTSLDDVMDNQATTMDPQFKKIGGAKFEDADFAAFADAAERLNATTLKIKDFSKGLWAGKDAEIRLFDLPMPFDAERLFADFL